MSAKEVSITRLEAADRRVLVEACDVLTRHDLVRQTDDFVREAQLLSARLSESLRRSLIEFRRFGHPSGGILIRHVPLGGVPPTPDRAAAAVGAKLPAAAAMSVLVACLGDQYGFRPELGGNIVQDILPVRGFEDQQISIGSTIDIEAHTEMAFSLFRSDYLALLCVRPDHERKAGTTLHSIDQILPLLDEATIRTLRQARFRTMVDPSFLLGDGITEDIWVEPVEVLSGPEQRPRMRFDLDGTKGNDPESQAALEEFAGAAAKARSIVRLDAGDLLIIDNNRALHGRTPFAPRYDGCDRWLLRAFVTKDLRRSEHVRPGDGRIVEPDYDREANSAA